MQTIFEGDSQSYEPSLMKFHLDIPYSSEKRTC